jgi:penicillin-binding protein 1C
MEPSAPESPPDNPQPAVSAAVKQQARRRPLVRAIAGVALFAIAAVGVIGLAAVQTIGEIEASLPPLPAASAIPTSTVVVDRDGRLLRPFTIADGRWRLPVAKADVDRRYLDMLVAYEDRHFADHHGVDPRALVRAAVQFVLAGGHIVSGGSTLTMQVARLLEPGLLQHRGVFTKGVQAIRALQLEERYSKDEILSLYLTLAPMGGNLEGVRAASLSYFGKAPAALDLAESALLVALPQSPVKARPDRHAAAARAARNHVLDRMVALGVVTAADAAVAKKEGVPFARQPMPLTAPHLAQRLVSAQRREDGGQGPRTKSEGVIKTTIDARIQDAA